jgi:hypothetical protein
MDSVNKIITFCVEVKMLDVLVLLIPLNLALNNAVTRIQVLSNSATGNSYCKLFHLKD